MDTNTFNRLVTDARARQDKLLLRKGADYTRQSEDRLSNFKRNAEALGLNPFQVWGVYAGKHWDAIMTFVKTGKVESEEIEGRLDDLINYLYLFEGLLKDKKGA